MRAVANIFPDPTSGLRLRRALAPIASNALLGFIFMAVHALDLAEIVIALSLRFALPILKVH